MTSISVADLAAELHKSTHTLLEQLASAGVPKASVNDAVSEADKHKLLSFLQTSHGTASAERKKITLTKKSTSEIKQADATGRARTIQVEVRKKRTFIQRDEDVVAEPPAPPAIDPVELARLEEEARQQAEQLRQQEEELAQKRREREEQEARDAAVEEAERTRERDREAARARAQEEAARLSAARHSYEKKPEQAASSPAPVPPAEPVAVPQPAEAVAPAVVVAPAAPVVPVAPAGPSADDIKRAALAKAAAEKAAEAAKAKDLQDRRRKAEAEAAAIREMMSAPKKVLVAKKPEPPPEVKPAAADAKAGLKGTLHKPAGTPNAARPAVSTTGAGAGAAGAGKKEVKSENLSSTWKDDAAKKKEIKTRGDTSNGRSNWRSGPKGRKGDRDSRDSGASSFAAPAETKVLEIHVPETITVTTGARGRVSPA